MIVFNNLNLVTDGGDNERAKRAGGGFGGFHVDFADFGN